MTTEEMKKLDIAEFAEKFYGFKRTQKSTKNSPSLKNGVDHIVVKYHPDGKCTFFSPESDKKGDIFNFVEWQQGCNFKESQKFINKFLGVSDVSAVSDQQIKATAKAAFAEKKTAVGVAKAPEGKQFDQKALEKLKTVDEHQYLESRGIPSEILKHKRFFGTVLTDEWNNAVFPHLKDNKIVGYTKKNYKFNGFSEGGEKLLWKSNQFKQDNRLVVAESAIDALSKATFEFSSQKTAETFYHTRFVSIDGGMSQAAEEALKAEIKALPDKAEVVAAFDNDDQGRKYLEKLQEFCKEAGKNCVSAIPKIRKDWNEVLVAYREREKEKAEFAEPATENQKKMIRSLANEGILTDINEVFLERLTKTTAKKMIFVGLKKKEAQSQSQSQSQSEDPEMSM